MRGGEGERDLVVGGHASFFIAIARIVVALHCKEKGGWRQLR